MTVDAGARAVGLVDPPAIASIVADRHRPRDYYLRRFLAATDVASLVGATLLVLLLTEGWSNPWHLAVTAAMVPVWLVLFALYELYDRDIRRISHTTIDDIPGVLHALLVGTLIMWALSRIVPGENLLFKPLAFSTLLGAAAVLTLRAVVRTTARGVLGPERVLVVGSGPSAPTLVDKIRQRTEYGLEAVGAVSHEASARWPLPLPTLGAVGTIDIRRLVHEHRIDRVVVATFQLEDERLLELLRACKQMGVKVSFLPAMFSVMGHSTQIDDLAGLPLLGINPPVLSRSSRLTKRTMDVIGAGAGLLVAGPAMLALALAIRLDSPGPVLFRQERVGKGGRHFELLKFRTMVADAEQRRAELLAQSKDPNWLHLEADPRITRLGRFLRHTSLDELPQLWNIVRGEMSLVGPRPLIVSEDEQVNGWRRSRLDLTPGLTGLWQVLGRTSIPFDEMVKLDYAYVANWSLWEDVRLILRTVPAVLTRRGSN